MIELELLSMKQVEEIAAEITNLSSGCGGCPVSLRTDQLYNMVSTIRQLYQRMEDNRIDPLSLKLCSNEGTCEATHKRLDKLVADKNALNEAARIVLLCWDNGMESKQAMENLRRMAQ